MNYNYISKDKVELFALVKKAEARASSKGGKFLDLTLTDADGEVNAKFWDFDEETTPVFADGTVVKIIGTVSEYRGTPQLRIETIREALPSDSVNISDLVPAAEYDSEDMFSEIINMFSNFEDEDLKQLCIKIYEENQKKLLYYPAAVKLHHAMRGGLLYHTLSIMKVAKKVCSVYPLLDRDLLLAGAALHDIGKTVEMNSNEFGVAGDYTVDGNLIGHLVRGAMMVRKCGTNLGTPNEKIRLIEHMLLSHHGSPEFGAAVRPAFTEAAVLSMLDELDAKIYEFAEITSQTEIGKFSGRQWALDDVKVYNHGRRDIKPKANLIENTEV